MENEMIERVEQLEEKVKRLEAELARTMRAPKQVLLECSGKGYCFNIWSGCSRADYRLCNHNSYLVCRKIK